jgi:excinuclease UvrABC nuclease subunit
MNNIKIQIKCPCCNSSIDPNEHKGIVLNRKLFLSSQIIVLKEQIEHLSPNKFSKIQLLERRASLQQQIEAHKNEIVFLNNL